MSIEKIGSGYVKVSVKQEELEESIAALTQLKPILQKQVTQANGRNELQAAIDRAEIGKHFDTAITAMWILYSNYEASETAFEDMVREANEIIKAIEECSRQN